MSRIMGIDYGAKTVGLALSDELKIIASPLTTLKREKENALRGTLREIIDIIRSKDVGLIVLGLPLNMDDSVGERAEKTTEFRDRLSARLKSEGLDIDIVLYDERLTTFEADEVLRESSVSLKDRKKYVDNIAAAIILNDYLRSKDGRRKDTDDNG